MKITVIGGGPGGLYFSILTKKAMPHCQIDIYERNKPDDSFGFGVVFSDETLGEFLKRDMQSYELIRSKSSDSSAFLFIFQFPATILRLIIWYFLRCN